MDTLTHALSGALLGRAIAPRHPAPGAPGVAQYTLAGGLAAAFPDSDVLFSLASPLAYLLNHRGITHSLLMLPLWAVLLALAMALLTRRLRAWRGYLLPCAAGIGIHIAGDLITNFGTMVLAPLSNARYALSTTFIIDLVFSGIIVAGLAASALWRKSRTPAVAALAMLCAYVGVQGLLRQQAIEVGQQYARASGMPAAQVDAIPRPPLATNWTVVVSTPDEYRIAHVNLWRDDAPVPNADAGFLARLHAAYAPPAMAQWSAKARFGASADERALAQEAWQQAAFGFYRWFAALPALYRIDHGNPSTCVWFEDLRFLIPGRGAYPFRYGMCREAGGPWQRFGFGAGMPLPL